MSLKALHIVFITASTLLALGFAAWSFANYRDGGATSDLIYAIVSVLAGVGLVVYGRYFLKKLKHVGYL